MWVAKARGIRSVFVEVYDRIDSRSLTGRLVAPFADAIVLQRQEQLKLYPRGRVLGPVR